MTPHMNQLLRTACFLLYTIDTRPHTTQSIKYQASVKNTMTATATRLLFVGGPSGTGKTTVGSVLSEELCKSGFKSVMVEGDDYHTATNIAKMKNGVPLTDEDRWPWLEILCGVVKQKIHSGGYDFVIVTCSMLKKAYRDFIKEQFTESGIDVSLIVLQNTFENVLNQMKQRKDHFFKENMLRSQYDAFETPDLSKESHVHSVQCNGNSIPEIVHTITTQYL